MKERIVELAKSIKDLESIISAKATELKGLTDEYNSAEQELITEMKNDNVVVGDIPGVGQLKLKSSSHWNFKVEFKDVVFKFLRDNGEGSLIETKEDINRQTLRGWCNLRQKQNLPIPQEIYQYFKESVEVK